MNLPVRTCLVYQVYSLVRQELVLDILVAHADGVFYHSLAVLHIVECLVSLYQSLDNLDGIVCARL